MPVLLLLFPFLFSHTPYSCVGDVVAVVVGVVFLVTACRNQCFCDVRCAGIFRNPLASIDLSACFWSKKVNFLCSTDIYKLSKRTLGHARAR